jgi:hypothetical protein
MVYSWGPLFLGVRRLSALGFWAGPCGSSELSASKQTWPTLATRRGQLQHAAGGEYPFTDPAKAGMRCKFDLPPGPPVESVKRKTVNLLPFGHNRPARE